MKKDNLGRLTCKCEEYSCEESKTALGRTFKIRGPGMFTCVDPELHLPVDYEAEKLCVLLVKAYEAGKKARSKEICRMLGAKHETDKF
ncbi:MAG TPA: hypothetical protein VMX17_17040 [Candidatus Glassbacteria bacterium]|nr:hypothetical protein [Candidatus Glassbacteria bacterium]